MYHIYRIDRLLAEDIEYLGTKRKFWYSQDGRRYLFKAEERGTGEDWAEKIVCELAAVLGVPHVQYELANEVEGDVEIQPGVICPRFLSRPEALEMGNQLLFQRDPRYPSDDHAKYGIREHTVDSVAAVLHTLALPAEEWMVGAPRGIDSALDVFAGYLMLDAWVANQDRHHQNWGAIRKGQLLSLAPSYDHGASLARNLIDSERRERLATQDRGRNIETFAGKARSGFYASPDQPRTLLALDAFLRFREHATGRADAWLDVLAKVDESTIEDIVSEVPPTRMSPVTREFTIKLLMINQQRILDSTDCL